MVSDVTDLDLLVEERTLAAHMGFKSVEGFREKLRYQGAPHYRLGRLIFFHRQELFDWLKENVQEVHQVRGRRATPQ